MYSFQVFAFKFNLRRYSVGTVYQDGAHVTHDVHMVGRCGLNLSNPR